jgi:hypothetical protein
MIHSMPLRPLWLLCLPAADAAVSAAVCCLPQLDAQDSKIIADSASGWRVMKPSVELSWPDVIRPVYGSNSSSNRSLLRW